MRDFLRDPEQMRGALARKVLAAALGSVSRLARAARGATDFDNDHQIRACVALARLVPAMFGPATHAQDALFDPQPWTPQRVRSLEKLIELSNQTREQTAEAWAASFRESGPLDGHYRTEEEARQYGRALHDRACESDRINERVCLDARKKEARKAFARRSRI